MDVPQIRSAFLGSEQLGDRIKRFREERLTAILAGDTPVPLVKGPTLVVHALPLVSFSPDFALGIGTLKNQNLRPLYSHGWSGRTNIDGYVSFTEDVKQRGISYTYCQCYRSGRIEAALADITHTRDGALFIGPAYAEKQLIIGLMGYLNAMKAMAVPLPVVITFTLLGMKGAQFELGDRYLRSFNSVIDRQVLSLPELTVESYSIDVARALRPTFDGSWQAAGFDRSFSYDEKGDWTER